MPLALEASDYQEAKNIDTVGNDILPNTSYLSTKITVVNGPTVSWIEPPAGVCAFKHDQLTVVADSTTAVKQVVFSADGKRVGVDKSGPGGVYSHSWNTTTLKQGKHTLTATATDASGRQAHAGRAILVCR